MSYKTELVSLGIPEDDAEEMLYFDKSKATWNELLQSLREKSKSERREIIDSILRQGKEQKKDTPIETISETESTTRHKYPEVKKEAQDILKEKKEIKCLKKEPELRKESEEFDQKASCKGAAVYVCHNCGRNICSQHSYWIPDKEFPYLVKKPTKKFREWKFFNLFLTFGIVMSIIGIFSVIGTIIIELLLSLIIGIVLLISGVTLIIVAFLKRYEKVGEFYPTFITHNDTKWNQKIQVEFEHRGYYSAVHCWNCLNSEHPKIMKVAREIFNEIYELAEENNWKQKLGDKEAELTGNVQKECAMFAANVYLNIFKYSDECYLPLGKDNDNLRIMIRPNLGDRYIKPVKGDIYNPTPLWTFRYLDGNHMKKEEVPSISVDEWINENLSIIKEEFSIIR